MKIPIFDPHPTGDRAYEWRHPEEPLWTAMSAYLHIKKAELSADLGAYGGDAYRKQFGIWVAKARNPELAVKDNSTGGAVLKYLRKKAGIGLVAVSSKTGLSPSYLSRIETGLRALPPDLRDKLIQIYGYSPSSFKNFTTEDKRAKNVPARYKLNSLLKQMSDAGIERMLGFALTVNEARTSASQGGV